MSAVPRGLRACLVCAFVQTGAKFHKNGCPNCEHFLDLRRSTDHVSDCTSEVFEGLVTVSDTTKGWVSKWLRIQGYEAGIYATKVNGILPEEFETAAESAGVRYIPRDGSANDEAATSTGE